MSFSFKKVMENSTNILLQYLETNDCSDPNSNIDFLCASSEIEEVEKYCPQIQCNSSSIEDHELEKSNISNTHIYIPPRDKRKSQRNRESDKHFFCTVCNYKFLEPIKLYKHCNSQHPQTEMSGRPCDYCNERFQDFKTLLVHRRKHITPYVCAVCWKGYMELSDLNEHTLSCKAKTESTDEPQIEPKRIMCHICGKSYPTTYIKVHMLIHSEGNIQCKYCGKTFKQPCSLSSHILWNHKKERVHNCEYCELVFITSSARTRHVRKIHKKERKFPCNSCGKKFFCSSELKRHMLTHSGVKNYVCDHCDKAYQTRYGLNVHLKSHEIQIP